ncbi:apolipoprotein L2-like isoform X1 [Talpa occidentalis]|uniref:apolipoprotein L2-like isoform X1 n=1 Tax=Talpa occidentalis TaxID=50954 RepID=UPI00188E7B0E|nr:apolipoprotein L2-like isoform X1 [Talpa occidentalis]
MIPWVKQHLSSPGAESELAKTDSDPAAGTMSQDNHTLHPENNFLKDVIEYVLCTVSREELQSLLNEANVWETFVTEAHLSRDEAEALREELKKLKNTKVISDEDMHQKEQECKKKFLQLFPLVKVQLEEHIAQLRELADRADKVHRDCTISSAVAHSTGILSGILTILGLGVLSFTTGASLALTVTGLGLGAAAAVTRVTTTIVEHISKSSVEAEANHLESADFDIVQLARDILNNSSQFGFLRNSFMAAYRIAKYIQSIKMTRINPGIAAEILVQSGRLVESAAGTTSVVMSEGTRLFSGATAGFFLLMDVLSLMQESKNLQQGVKTELSEKLMQQAQELEMMLEKLNHIYKSVQ